MFLREIACGPLALIRVLESLDRPLSDEEAERLVDEAGEKVIDMLRLKELAEQHGMHALGLAVAPEHLRQMGQRAIVHLNGVGFLPVLEYVSDGMVVAYPASPPGVLPDDLFAKWFGAEGKALLISNEPLTPIRLGLRAIGSNAEKPRSPHLRLERSMIAVGRIHRRNWNASLTLTNDGDEALEIKKVETNCSCFTASPHKQRLEPGESTELHTKGTQEALGGFLYSVEVYTNANEGSPIRIPVRGYLEQPAVFVPPVAFFTDLLPEQKAESEVRLELPRRINHSDLKLVVPNGDSFAAEIVEREQGVGLRLHWAGASVPGVYSGNLELRVGDAKDAVATRMPWTVQVVPSVIVYPPSLWIEMGPGGTWNRQLTIESRRDLVGDPSLCWSKEEAGKAIKTKLVKDGDHTVRVTLIGEMGKNPEQITLTVMIGKDQVSVPVRMCQTRP